jgi:hypothetical protein
VLGTLLKQGIENVSVSVLCGIGTIPWLIVTGRQCNTNDNDAMPEQSRKWRQHGLYTGEDGVRMAGYYNDVSDGNHSLEALHVTIIFRYRSGF